VLAFLCLKLVFWFGRRLVLKGRFASPSREEAAAFVVVVVRETLIISLRRWRIIEEDGGSNGEEDKGCHQSEAH